jgi:hypothetical protein
MSERLSSEEQRVLTNTMLEINEKGWGIALGLTLGLGLFIATNMLVLKGGSDVGSHLRLLRVYFPGYQVTFLGSLIGFVYAFVLGYATGRAIILIYNRLTAGMR